MKRLILACLLGVILTVSLATAAFAHTHIDLPNGECVDIPASQEGNAHDGIGIAKTHSPVLTGPWCD